MNVEERRYSVKDLVDVFESRQLLANPEYQRGEAWSHSQKAGFIDSIFRRYPVPALFLHELKSKGLDDVVVSRWEIVDGQQRLTALKDYVRGRFHLLPRSNAKLRLPKSLRMQPAPWEAKNFEQLDEDLQTQLLDTQISAFMIQSDVAADEVRDLFIRLQSGTALSRQQIRDAWPGDLGPYVERLAGKLDRQPSHRLFAIIDRRGQRVDEEDHRDRFVVDRQLCAQLLRVFLARERDPNLYPSVSANDLDAMYHEYTEFEDKGPQAQRFHYLLEQTAQVLEQARDLGARTRFRRLEVSAVMMYLQDVTRSPRFKFEPAELGYNMVHTVRHGEPVGNRGAGTVLQAYYTWWRTTIAQDVGVYLDDRRLFSEDQKRQIFTRDGGICQVCNAPVNEDAEYDHFPIPYRDGGQTDIDNGRLVHQRCHERGRPRIATTRIIVEGSYSQTSRLRRQ